MSEEQSPFVEVQSAPEADNPIPEAAVTDNRWGAAPWAGGLVLIALGVIFLLRNMGLNLPILRNWWALFILIPAVSSLAQAWRSYQASGGHFGGHVSGQFVGGLVLLLVAATFLLGWSWAVIWPVFLILAGVGALLGGLVSR